MRPLSITLSGVRSYTGTCGPLDFTGKSLVGILGDTGAGKSTLLEAITYALYGRTSWGEGGSQLIADGCTKMSIDFAFAVDGTTWHVTRVCHRGGRASDVRLHGGDTAHGTSVDGATRVNQRIRQLLNLEYDSFKSAVLLPQGKFDVLLNATGTHRTQLLKSLLGIEELQRLRQRADNRRARFTDLVLRATEARGRLAEDPEADAHRLRIRQTQAEKTAADLSGHLKTLCELQRQAGDLQQHSTDTTRAATALTECTATDVHAPLTALITDDQALRRQLEIAHRSQEKAEQKRDRLQASLDEDRTAGLSISTLAAAAEVLEGAPGLLNSIGEQQQELQQDLDRFQKDEQSIASDEERLADQAARLTGLRENAERAHTRADEAGSALERLTGAVRVLLEEGAAVAGHRGEETAARDRYGELSAASADAEAALARQRGLLEEAERAVEEVQRSEAAHTAGRGLSTGDACPVCTHPVDDSYAAPEPQDPKALKQAKQARAKAATAANNALHVLRDVQSEILQAQRAQQEHREKAEAATGRMDAQLSPVQQHAQDVATLTGHDAPESFAAQVLAEAGAAVDALLAHGRQTAAERLALLETLLPQARLRVGRAQDAATAVHDTARSAAAEVQAGQAALGQRRKTLSAGREKAEREQQRLDRARRQFLDRLTSMPQPVRLSLPDADALPSPQAIAACTSAVAAHLGRLGDLDRAYTQALEDLRELATQRERLAGEHRRCVAEPLRRQQAELERRAAAAATAAHLLHDGAVPLPPPPAAWDEPQDVADHATALDAACAALHEALDAGRRSTQNTLDGLAAKAATAYQALMALTPQTPLPLAAGMDLLFAADLLTPVHEQTGALRKEAERATSDLEEALAQIPHVLELEAAIAAGKQQQSAWTGLYEQMSDSKFPSHLADLRTHALLIHGSRLLKELSAGQFAFSKDFRIVSLGNNTARSPRTLSGGETFQASLALSLALVELHSRTSARLESLFLDEGFATLDAGALESALSVLRTHVGSDKLLAVISHLHPVAESVHDVLWVKKDVSGSTARWLAPEEHHTLVRSDSHNLAELT
ncbi:AAA family ATPase [Streptomyces aureus]|uniref:AAA family ATPase n=1 Tax=Streptomyces aureus TaxID=193461 RepID=UPI00056078EE|nr:SMC family ATPase [Streptomyces aureus]